MENAKLFVGGISRETTEGDLSSHFSKYGVVSRSLIAKDRATQHPRGFGFVWFEDPAFADLALDDSEHVILGRKVEVKRAVPRGEQLQNQLEPQLNQPNQWRNSGFGENGSHYFSAKKIFVGGLSANVTREEFESYFQRFGRTVDAVVMKDKFNRPRGFGFVTFETEECVDRVMEEASHELSGRCVDVKRAISKEAIAINRPTVNSDQPGNNVAYDNSFGLVPVFNGGAQYPYGTGMYGGGFPVLGYARPGMVFAPQLQVDPRSYAYGPVVAGPVPYGFTYCSSGYLLPYINSGINTINYFNGPLGSYGSGTLTQVSNNNGLMPSYPTPLSTRMEVNLSGLKGP